MTGPNQRLQNLMQQWGQGKCSLEILLQVSDEYHAILDECSQEDAADIRSKLMHFLDKPIREISYDDAINITSHCRTMQESGARVCELVRHVGLNVRDEMSRRLDTWTMWKYVRGNRYSNCRLTNYVTQTDAQQEALEKCKRFAASIRQRYVDGNGVVLFGPRGTGKDHLMTGLVHEACRAGLHPKWVNGVELYAEVRSTWQDSSKSEGELLLDYKRCGILVISDPLPPTGPLTDFQQQVLFRIIDYRYAHSSPTWVTVNVASRSELDERMGAAAADRIIDGAMCVFCNWPSYRASASELQTADNRKDAQ